jgi:DNA polymerase-3 subunit delta'
MIPTVSELYPWLESPWQSLKSHIDSGRIPHALLMQGPAGLGKSALAALFARRLLCIEPGEMPCGHCHSCHLFEAGTHPDYQCVDPEEPGKAIKVDAIRKLINDLSLKPQYGGYRVFVVDQAEQMNLSSANALLKTLEEPAEQTVILLITHRPSRLPPTILSRCQKLSIRAPRKEAAMHWLQRQHLALTETDVVERRQRVFHEFGGVSRRQLDPVSIAERWHGQSHEECLNWMLSWVSDMVRLLMAPTAPRLSNADLEADLSQLAESFPIRNLMGFRDELLNFRHALGGQVNRQLLLEEALIGWSRLARHST